MSQQKRKLLMKNMALSILKVKQGVVIRCRQAGVWIASVVLLSSSLVPAQTSSVPQQHQKPSPGTEPAAPNIAVGNTSAYVDGAGSCPGRNGLRDCSFFETPAGIIYLGPFRKVGEGVRGVAPNGTLFLKAGSYSEPIVLNKKMEIRAYDGTATIGPSSLATFDLLADTVDDNGLPLNPRWGAQRKDPNVLPDSAPCSERPFSSLCTNQFTYLNDANVCGPHVNWFGATYQGIINWGGHECHLPFGDDDYNMHLMRSDRAGYTSGNSGSLKCEFDSDETIDHFSTPWWSDFREAVDENGCGSPGIIASQILKNRFAIVSGVFGLDCEHECHSEIHPVWALAMNVRPAIYDDLWTLFVRNWGNEGYCGNSQEYVDFPNNIYTFRLPWRRGATSVTVINSYMNAYHVGSPFWSVEVMPGEGVLVKLTLEAPREDGSMYEGELHLAWGGEGLTVEPLSKVPEVVADSKNDEDEHARAPKKKVKKNIKWDAVSVKPHIVTR